MKSEKFSRSIIIVLIAWLNLLDFFSCHSCGIDFLNKPKKILLEQPKSSRQLNGGNLWGPIKIHFDLSNIENNVGKYKNEDLIDLRDKVLKKTKTVLESLLQVKKTNSNLKLPYPQCDNIIIPELYQDDGEGIDADIVIFALIDDTGFFLKNKIEAAAIHCFQDSSTRRPIAGYIQFKPELNVNNSTAEDYMVWLAVHEITHILVMNDALYEDWVNKDNKPYGFSNVVGKKTLPNSKIMTYLKTPKILEIGKKHFNCQEFYGLPLEYNGGPGTAGAHWSKKMMNTDYMIGDSYGENLISDLSLAMFEDSGWYKVDYQLSNLFLWGKNKGCGFLDVTTKCVEKKQNGIVESQFKNEFCSEFNKPVCSTSNIFRGICQTRMYESLPPFERYLGESNEAGIDTLCDKCPIPIENKQESKYYGGSCRQGSTRSINQLEKVCPECACFMSNLKEKVKEQENRKFMQFKQTPLSSENTISITHSSEAEYGANCFEYHCEGKTLFIKINTKSYKCDKNEITLDGYEGTVKCPFAENLCHDKYKCKFGCVDKYFN